MFTYPVPDRTLDALLGDRVNNTDRVKAMFEDNEREEFLKFCRDVCQHN